MLRPTSTTTAVVLVATMALLREGHASIDMARAGGAAFAQPPALMAKAGVSGGAAACARQRVVLTEAQTLTGAGGGGGGSFKGGNGGNWGGRWGDGGQGGGGPRGRFNGLAFAANDGPRITNKTVVEGDTGVKFPPGLLLEQEDKNTVRFIGAGPVSHRNWKLQKVNDYAVGFYIDVDAAFKAFKKKVSTPELAREALLKSGVKKTIRIVLAKETDTFNFVKRINDNCESKIAKREFGDLMWLELWRDWLVGQGGYHTKLPKGVEIRFTWKYDTEDRKDVFVTEIRRRDRVLASKTLNSEALAWGVFQSVLGDKPISPAARDDISARMMNLCR